MRQTTLGTIVITLLTAAIVWYITTLPLQRTERRVIGLQGAPEKIITLQAGDIITQGFRSQQALISNVSIFSGDVRLNNQKLRLEVLDQSGTQLAVSETVQPSYVRWKLKLSFPLYPWVDTELNTPHLLEVSHLGGDPITLD